MMGFIFGPSLNFSDLVLDETTSDGIEFDKLESNEPTSEWTEVRNDLPTGESYFLHENFGGFWADVEKRANPNDDSLCWAAASSNMLEWTGWGFVGDMTYRSADDFFDYYKGHVSNHGSQINYGLKWWLSGELDSNWLSDIFIDWSEEVVDHDGFWTGYDPSLYIWDSRENNIGKDYLLYELRDELIVGKAVGISIYPVTGSGGHAVTVWGYNYDPDLNPNHVDYYKGLWITDSDNDEGSSLDVLGYYALEYDHDNNYWYMPNYGGGWYISSVTSLTVFPGNERPIAAGGPFTGLEGIPVTFSSLSTDPDGDPLEYRLDFYADGWWNTGWISGDYQRTFPDDYSGTVVLEVFDGRLRDIHFIEVTIDNVAPTIDIGSDRTAYSGETVTFEVDIDDPGERDTHSIEWDFGDGTTKTTAFRTTSHVYATNGVYEVRCYVTDDDGGFDSKSIHVYIENSPPIADAGPDQTVNQGDLVQFNGSYHDPDNNVVGCWWDFGDGSGIIADEWSPTHIYYGNHVYTATLTVIDGEGEVSNDAVLINVVNVPPIVDAGDNQTATIGEVITFSGDFYDPGIEIWTYHWDFGDESYNNSSLTPTHIYSDVGVYKVTLTVTDGYGGVGNDTLIVTVESHAPMVDAGPDQTVSQGDTVIFDGSFSDDDSTSWTIEWDFDDGGIVVSDDLSPTWVFYDVRLYTVTMTVTDDSGAVGMDTVLITVLNVAPTVEAGTDLSVSEGTEVEFQGSFIDPGNDSWGISWDFGDGSSAVSDTLEPLHTYVDDGTYTVTLTVIDQYGGVGTDTLEVTVTNVAPTIILFTFSQPNPDYILPVKHTLEFAGDFTDPGQDTITYSWDFGDESGLITDTLAPQHIYANPGVYQVTFSVQDDDGGSDVQTMTITVDSPEEMNQILNAEIQESSLSDQRKNAFDKMFKALDKMLENEDYSEMISFLENNVRGKVDGYVDGNMRNDWIRDEETQIILCKIIDEYISYLETLM